MALLQCYVVMNKDTGALKGTYVARDKVEVLDLWLKDQGFANVVEFAAAHTFGPLLNLDIIIPRWASDFQGMFFPHGEAGETIPGWLWDAAMKILRPMGNQATPARLLHRLKLAREVWDRLIGCLEKSMELNGEANKG